MGMEKEERKRKRKNIQAPTLGEIRPVLRVGGVSEGRAVSCEGTHALAQRETPKRQIWQEPSDSLAKG